MIVKKAPRFEADEVVKWNLKCELAYLLRERGTNG